MPRISNHRRHDRCFCCLSVLVIFGWCNSSRAETTPAQPTADAAKANTETPQPSPKFSPEEVIRFQLAALTAKGKMADRIANCYRFASPANREHTGPVERFAKMFESPSYDSMLSAKNFLVGKARVKEHEAHLLLTVIDDKNQLHIFRCFLSKQKEGDWKDCWMTDAVIPVGSGKPAAPPRQPSSSI